MYEYQLKIKYYWIEILFWAIIFLISFGQMDDSLFISGSIVGILLIYEICKKKEIEFSIMDGLLIMIWVYLLLSIFFTTQHYNTFVSFKIFTTSILYYFFLRTGFQNKEKEQVLLLTLCLCIAIVCFISIISFFIFRNNTINVGFKSLYDFRYVYKPLGNLTNVWGSYMICGLGILALTFISSHKYKIVYVIYLFVSLGLITSFSRGVYLALLFFLAASVFLISSNKHVSIREKIFLVLLITLPCIAYACLFQKDVVTTLHYNKTISQQRSIEGRIDAMSSAKSVISDNKLFGVGLGNYTLSMSDYQEDYNNTFTTFAPNTGIQLLVEQGFIGLILWLSLTLFLFIWYLRFGINSIACNIITCSLIMLLIRELTFPTFFETHLTQFAVFTLLAFFHNRIDGKVLSCKITNYKIVSLVITLVILSLSVVSINVNYDKYKNIAFTELVKQGNYSEAEMLIKDLRGAEGYNNALINIILFDHDNDSSRLEQALCSLNDIKGTPNNIQFYNVALVEQKRGNVDVALSLLKSMSDKQPNNALYHYNIAKLLFEHNFTDSLFIYHLTSAIILSPGIIDMPESFFKNDTTLMRNISEYLEEIIVKKIEISNCDPITLAKYGKILLYIGDASDSYRLLSEAVRLLPNLVLPWYYLGKIEHDKGNLGEATIYFKRFLYLKGMSMYRLHAYTDDIYNISAKVYEDEVENNEMYNRYYMLFNKRYNLQTIIMDKYI